MPTNQSSPWDGGKPWSCSDHPSAAAIKVPLGQTCLEPPSRKDRAKAPSSDANHSPPPASKLATKDGNQTWNHCSIAPQESGGAGLKNGSGRSGQPEELLIQGQTILQLNSYATTADSSPSLPQCLRHHHASLLHTTRRESWLTRRIRSAKIVSKRRPGANKAPTEQHLLVRGHPPAAWRRSSPQEEEQGEGTSGPLKEDQENVQHVTVGSVTSQISSIRLSRRQAAVVKTPAPDVCSSLSEESEDNSLSKLKYVIHVNGAEGEEPVDEEASYGELENDLSDDASSIEEPMSLGAEDNREERPALVPSLFPFVPPTLYFSTANEKVELLPAEQRRLLKWKMSTVTPNVVKHTIARSHFKVTKRSQDWLGCWGHHMKSPCFKVLGDHQKLNHFPGTFQIGRKDQLWRNLSKMQLRFGKQEFSFFPRTFILPQDMKLLRKAWEDGGSRQKWIIKPPASARGIGIQVIHKWSQLPRRRPLLVQKYLHKPYLISGNKFDLRIYVYVTSYDPLRIYIFSDGLVRFASCKYSSSMKTLGNKFMHLTNYSVNKKNVDYQSNSDDKACQGHKWALKALWQYLGSGGINTRLIWEKIKDIVIKTVIASEPYVNSLMKMHVRSAYSCHELFGFDIMLDENLKPWILEVNISPSLHSNTALDVAIKGQMIRDLLNLAGFHVPQREDVLTPCSSASSSTSSLCGANRKPSRADVTTDEKVKRAFYITQRYAEQDFLSTVLDVLTPGDVRVLVQSEDEFSRRGEFERIFPSASSSRYLRFFECPRYLNVLLDQWEQKHWSSRNKGIALLRTLCHKGIHLGTSDPTHMWSKCSYISRCDAHKQELLSPSTSRVLVSSCDVGKGDSESEEASPCSLPTSASPGSSLSSSPQPGHTQSDPTQSDVSYSLLPQSFSCL